MDAHPPHSRLYELARCYDVAFGFRDVAAECDTLAALWARHGPPGRPGRPDDGVLELAAGPARHAREFARRGHAAWALDASPAMCAYASTAAAGEGVALATVCADMVDFDLAPGASPSLALLLMDSASYLLDNDAVLRHLRCVARHLAPGGLYVLEMSHPRDAFGPGTSTRSCWTREEDGLRVDTAWGAPDDAFDPLTQIDEVTVTLAWSGPEGSGRLTERARQRRCTATEFDALVRASGAFDVVEWLGALAPPCPLSNDPAAWRMVPVLRKRETPA